MYVQNSTSQAIDQERRLDRSERVIRPFRIVLAGGNPIYPGCVDCLDFTEFVQLNCQTEKRSPDPHLELLFSRTNGREVRQCGWTQPENSSDSRHLVQDFHHPPIRLVEVLPKRVDRNDNPICVACFSFADSWSWRSTDGFLSNGYDPLREAGEFCVHNQTTPLHFLVLCHVEERLV